MVPWDALACLGVLALVAFGLCVALDRRVAREARQARLGIRTRRAQPPFRHAPLGGPCCGPLPPGWDAEPPALEAGPVSETRLRASCPRECER
jgi:hypothetical protein